MREVDLYTLKKEKVLVTSDYISVAQYSDKPVHIRGSDEFVVNAPVEVQRLPVERYVKKTVSGREETLVAFDPKIRELLGINEKKLKEELSEIDKMLKDALVKNWELTEEKYNLQEQYDSALKTNENLVEYKNDLLRENATLIEKLFTYTTMSFWKRLVFLFTGKV